MERLQIQAGCWIARPSHILHIIGSFAGHEYEAGLVLSFFHWVYFLKTCDRNSDLAG